MLRSEILARLELKGFKQKRFSRASVIFKRREKNENESS
jgi:hypothetical protein